jgi:hypothetical protein
MSTVSRLTIRLEVFGQHRVHAWPNTNFADITEFVYDVSYKRGRQKVDDQFGAGTMQFTMRDETGILGPYDTSSPYYDPANSEPGLAPLRRVRLKRDSTELFTGVVTGYDYKFEMAGPKCDQCALR